MRRFHIGPIARISAGLTALLISMALLVDMLLGVVPSQGDADHRVRKRVAENLALQLDWYKDGQFWKGDGDRKVQIDYIQHNATAFLHWAMLEG